MSPENSKFALDVFDRSLLVPDEERRFFLNEACRGNLELQAEVESLLAVAGDAGDFLDEPLLSLPELPLGEFAVGAAVGKYRIERLLGEGGMGTVYLAERDEPGFNVQAAIKTLRPGKDGEEVVSRFLREHEILAKLDHPNIAKPFDRGMTAEGLPYLVMEYVHGSPIDEYCDTHKLSTADRLHLFRKVCSAVHFAHQNLIIHRDLKPANILVTPQGEPKLLDFGVAGLVEPSPFSTKSETLRRTAGGFFGTLRYASPEQVRNVDSLTTAADVYSLGVLLYELLTGHYPFQKWSDSFLDLSNAICEENPEKPSTVVERSEEIRSSKGDCRTLTPELVSATREGDPGHLKRSLTGDLDKIVLKALSKEPAQRYASADELSDDLERHLEGLPVSAQEPTFTYQLKKFFQRHTAQVLTGAGLLLLITAFGFFAAWLWQNEKEAREERERALNVSDYLVRLYGIGNPGEGDSIPAKSLLDSSRGDLQRAMQMDDLPETQKDLLRSQLPSDLPGVMDAVGWAYYGLGAYEDADKWLSEGLVRRRRAADSPDGELAAHLLRLAAARTALGHEKEAAERHREALEILSSRKVDDLRLAQALQDIGILLRRHGELDAAVDVQRQALEMLRRVGGEQEFGVLLGLNNLGVALWQLGRYDEAESVYRESLKLHEERFTEHSPELDKVYNNFANNLRDLGFLDPDRREEAWSEAESFFQKSLAARRSLYGERASETGIALNNLAYLLKQRGELGRAEELFEEALRIFRDSQGQALNVGVVLRNRATLYQEMGRAEAAERDARQALEIFTDELDLDHWRAADAESVLGGCLLDLGRVGEAAPYLERSLPAIEAVKDPGDRVVREARRRRDRLAEIRAASR